MVKKMGEVCFETDVYCSQCDWEGKSDSVYYIKDSTELTQGCPRCSAVNSLQKKD